MCVKDTLSWQYFRDKIVPSVHSLDVAPDLACLAHFIEGFLRSQSQAPNNGWVVALHPIMALRPQAYVSLPHLDPKVPRVTPSRAAEPLPITKSDTPSVAISTQSNPGEAQHGRPSTFEHRPTHATGLTGTFPDDLKHVKKRDDELQRMNNKRGKTAGIADCDDFPRTQVERQQLISKLVDAMVNYEDIVEKPIASKSRRHTSQDATSGASHDEDAPALKDNYRVERVRNTSKAELEILASKVLWYIKDAQDGNIFLPDRYGKQVEYTKFPSFMARYEKVLEALKFSKALVDDLMAWDHCRRLVAAPDKEYVVSFVLVIPIINETLYHSEMLLTSTIKQRKKTNKSGNDKKTVQLKAGIKALKESQTEAVEDTAVASADDLAVTSDEDQKAADDQLSGEAIMAAQENNEHEAMSMSSAEEEDDTDI
ncbi:hypothetical protein BR93DRAFT_214809 [Coniochaeta sp. PMI_546]|nr:hypothetical protein BR93DRAFT_214809 [Coniochaeta sp. PMI_546]